VTSFSQVEDGSVLGTSSIRRRANILFQNDSIEIRSCRGNVPSRLQKLEDRESPFDALVLAMAGLERLDESIKLLRMIRPSEMLPAPGQGAIAVVCRTDRDALIERFQSIEHPPSRSLCRAERSFLHTVEGGCQAPVGALGKFSGGQLVLEGSVTHPEGEQQLRGRVAAPPNEAGEVGEQLANQLIDRGARDFIQT